MNVPVTCPNPECGKTYLVADDTLGKKATCKHCGQAFTLTAGADDTQAVRELLATQEAVSAIADVPLPSRLGRFEIRSRLGAGAFGVVYQAYDPTLDRAVALKVPHPGLLDSRIARERFLREPKAAAQLRYPNIVPVYEAGVDGDTYFIAAAFIEGQTLKEAIEEGRFDCQKSAKIVLALAEALDYAHGRGIVHRDVKPANIMLDSDGQPLLMDFGLAQFADSESKLTRDGAVLGTPAYMPPEQASGRLDLVGPKSDQYSLGVVLYELLTGQTPFSGPPSLVISMVISQPLPSPRDVDSKIPRDLETICLKTMSKDQGCRYATCRDLADDLRRWLADEPIRARPLGPLERLTRWSRQNPLVASLSAASLVLLLAVAAVTTTAYFRELDLRQTAEVSQRTAEEQTTKAEEQTIKAEEQERIAREEAQRAERAQADAEEQARRAEAEKRKATAERDRAEKAYAELKDSQEAQRLAEQQRDQATTEVQSLASELGTWEGKGLSLYRERIALAHQKWLVGDLAAADRLLEECPAEFRHWEWGFLRRACRSEDFVTLPAPLGESRLGNGRTAKSKSRPGNERTADSNHDCVGLAFFPDGKRLAGKFANGEVVVWNVPEQRILTQLQGPAPPGDSGLMIGPDGNTILATFRPSNVSVWNVPSGKCILSSDGSACSLHPSIFDQTGRRVALGTTDGQIKVWELGNGNEHATPLAILPTQNRQIVSAVAFGNEALLAAVSGSQVELWDIERRTLIDKVTQAGGWLLAGSSSESRSRDALVAGSKRPRRSERSMQSESRSRDEFVAGAGGNKLKSWRWSSEGVGRVYEYQLPSKPLAVRDASTIACQVARDRVQIRGWQENSIRELEPFDGDVQSVVFGPPLPDPFTSERVATTYIDANRHAHVRVDNLDSRSGLPRRIIERGSQVLAFSHDGRSLAVSGEEICVWNLEESWQPRYVQPPAGGDARNVEWCCSSFLPNGKAILGHADHYYGDRLTVRGSSFIVDLRSGTLTPSQSFPGEWLSFSPDARWLATTCGVFDTATGAPAPFQPPDSLAPEANADVSTTKKRKSPAVGEQLNAPDTVDSGPKVSAAAFLDAKRMLFFGSSRASLHCLDLESGQVKAEFLPLADFTQDLEPSASVEPATDPKPSGYGNRRGYRQAGFAVLKTTRQGQRMGLLWYGPSTTWIGVWDVSTATPTLCFKQSLGDVPWGGTYDFSPDGESVVLRSEKGLQLLDAATGKIRVTLSSDGDYRNVAWTFSPDGSSAVLTREDGMLLLDAATGRTRVTLSNEPGFANVTYTQDGMRILAIRKSDVVWSGDRFQITTAAGNSELAVWDAASGQLILSLQTRGLRPSLASYGRFLVLGPWILEADDWRSNAADQAVPRANPAQSTAVADPALATPP